MSRKNFDPADYIGKKYGKLTVVRFDHDEYRPTHHGARQVIHYMLFRCDCGNEKILNYRSVVTTNKSVVRSCGCAYQEKMVESRIYPTVDGESIANSQLYNVYCGMISRCYNPKDPGYDHYGERGIYICDEWRFPDRVQGFTNFYNWSMSHGYVTPIPGTPKKDRPTIDRINNDGPYAPWNCRWTNYVVQGNNKRNCKHITDIDGEVLTYAQFDRKHNLPYKTTKKRMHSYKGKHWPLSAILYDAYRRDLGIHKQTGNGLFVDKNGYHILIPTIERMKEMYKSGNLVHGKGHSKHTRRS